VGNWGAPPNTEREKQFLAGSGGKVDLGARTQTETEQRARPNNNEQREAGPRKSRAGSDRRCREIQSGKKQDRRTTACGKKDSARKDRPWHRSGDRDGHESKNKLGRAPLRAWRSGAENEERKTRRRTGHGRLKRKRDRAR
jgi:hypothetical protein